MPFLRHGESSSSEPEITFIVDQPIPFSDYGEDNAIPVQSNPAQNNPRDAFHLPHPHNQDENMTKEISYRLEIVYLPHVRISVLPKQLCKEGKSNAIIEAAGHPVKQSRC